MVFRCGRWWPWASGAVRTVGCWTRCETFSSRSPLGPRCFLGEGAVHWTVDGTALLDPSDASKLGESTSTVTRLRAPTDALSVRVFSMAGLAVDLAVASVHDFIEPDGAFPLTVLDVVDIDGRIDENLLTRIGGGSHPGSFVVVQNASLALPWRGFGIGRILVDRALALALRERDAIVAVGTCPFDPWNDGPDESTPADRARARRVWESLGFMRWGADAFFRSELTVQDYSAGRVRELGLMTLTWPE